MQKRIEGQELLDFPMNRQWDGIWWVHGRGFTGLAGPALLHDEDWYAGLNLKGPQRHEIHVRDIPSPATVLQSGQ